MKRTGCLFFVWISVVMTLASLHAGTVPEEKNVGGISALFPELAGWSVLGKLQVFSPENLYEYIDGAAENFIAYEFQELAVQTYENAAKMSLTIEIYRHGNALDAFGIFSSEKPLAGEYLQVGSESYAEEGVLNFCQGNYYVKITAMDVAADTGKTLRQAAQEISQKIGGPATLPGRLGFFPLAGKVAHSERFILHNFLGHSFLHSGFRVDYERKGRKFQLFLLTAADRNDAREMVAKWLEKVKKKAPAEVAEKRYVFVDPYNGPVVLQWTGAYVWGTLNCPEDERPALETEMKENAAKLER